MGLGFLYQEKEHEVKLLRCYSCGEKLAGEAPGGWEDTPGEGGVVALPESIRQKPVTEIGDYIFSADMDGTPGGSWWSGSGAEDSEAAGPEAAGSEADRSEEARPGPGSAARGDAVCGGRVRELILPATLKRIGRYAFYNCDRLRSLRLPGTIEEIGAGAFNGCRKITDLHIDVAEGEKSCLKELLSDLNETLTVHYRELGRSASGRAEVRGEARLVFPLFYEEAVENTPARILETHVHGCGHRYRYCFAGTEFKFHEYDALFPHARAQEAPEHVAALAMWRLRLPYRLSEAAGREYAGYLLGHLEDLASCLLEEGGMDGWRWLVETFSGEGVSAKGWETQGEREGTNIGRKKELNGEIREAGRIKNEHATAGCLGNEGLAARAREEYYDIRKPVLGETGFDKLIQITNRAGHTEATSFLMDARYRACPPRRKRFSLSLT